MLGRYFNSATAFSTRLRVEGRNGPMSFNTRDTVAVETLALFATSSSLIMCHFIIEPSGHRAMCSSSHLMIEESGSSLRQEPTNCWMNKWPDDPIARWLDEKWPDDS